MLHVVSVCTPCWMSGCCCVLLRKVWNRSNFSANNSQHFFCSVIAEAKRNNAGSVCTALPTLLGPRTFITHGLQRLMLYPSRDALQVPTLLGVVLSVWTPLPAHTQQLPTLLRQQCLELLRPFARSLREFLKDTTTADNHKNVARKREFTSFQFLSWLFQLAYFVKASELFWSWISITYPSSWREWILSLLVYVLHKTWN